MNLQAIKLFCAFLTIGVVPPALIVVLSKFSSIGFSYWYGVLGACISLLLIFVTNIRLSLKWSKIHLLFVFSVIIWILFREFIVIMQSSTGWLSYSNGQTVKVLASLIVFLFILLISNFFSKVILNTSTRITRSVMLNFTYFMIVVGYINVFTNFKLGVLYKSMNSKVVFPFNEPSHFALMLTYFCVYALLTYEKLVFKLCLIGMVLGLALLIPSATLAVACLMMLILLVRADLRLLILAVPLIYGFGIVVQQNVYFSERFFLSNFENNASALVYKQGFESIQTSLHYTSGFGLGFQRLGTQPISEATLQIIELTGRNVNRLSGGFLSAKILSEFGVIGFFLIGIYLFFTFYVFVFLNRYQSRRTKIVNDRIFLIVAIFPFFIELFVRSPGYFAPSSMLFYIFLLTDLNERAFRGKYLRKP